MTVTILISRPDLSLVWAIHQLFQHWPLGPFGINPENSGDFPAGTIALSPSCRIYHDLSSIILEKKRTIPPSNINRPFTKALQMHRERGIVRPRDVRKLIGPGLEPKLRGIRLLGEIIPLKKLDRNHDIGKMQVGKQRLETPSLFDLRFRPQTNPGAQVPGMLWQLLQAGPNFTGIHLKILWNYFNQHPKVKSLLSTILVQDDQRDLCPENVLLRFIFCWSCLVYRCHLIPRNSKIRSPKNCLLGTKVGNPSCSSRIWKNNLRTRGFLPTVTTKGSVVKFSPSSRVSSPPPCIFSCHWAPCHW